MRRLVLATRNAHKTREFAQILGPDFVVVDLSDFPAVPAVEETGSTFEENAILKAAAVSLLVDDLVAADDSGLEVAALNGAPGVRSARYAGENASDSENVSKLLRDLTLADPELQHREARFVCALAIAQRGAVLRNITGAVSGVITTAPQGESGFGYDPIFIPAGEARTFAELGDEIKNQISHRADAIAQLREGEILA